MQLDKQEEKQHKISIWLNEEKSNFMYPEESFWGIIWESPQTG